MWITLYDDGASILWSLLRALFWVPLFIINMDAQELDTLWMTVLEQIKLSVSVGTFATYFSPSKLISIKPLDGDRQLAEIAFGNPFLRENVEHKYWGIVKNAIDTATGKKNDLVFTAQNRESKLPERENGLTSTSNLFSSPTEDNSRAKRAHLRPDFVFDSFAVSSSNQMAWAAASAVAKNPGTTYNPLFLYGGVGVGKTHLMQAVGNAMLLKNPQAKIIYCPGEEFTNELVESIRTNTTQKFKEKYRTVDALLLDDIQFIAGKKETQEEFFHTFNVILREGGQVIMTSDRTPQEINIEDRLRTRFEAGLVIDVPEPDMELRAAILLIKARQKGIDFPPDLAPLVAEAIEHPRQLEGFLVKLQNEIAVNKKPIDQSLINTLLGKQTKEIATTKVVSPSDVVNLVASYFQIGVGQLKGERRSQPLAHQRQILMYILKTEGRLPLTEVGRILGGRDHTTVIHATDKIKVELTIDPQIQKDVSAIKKLIYGQG